MKKIFALILIMIFIITFTACEKKQASTIDDKVVGELISEFKPLKELPEKYDSELAQRNGDVVSVHGKGYNVEKFNAFIEKLEKKEPAMVRITQYTIEGDAIIKDLIYDGKFILLKDDNTRDKFAGTENQKVIEYKASDIIVSKSNDGTQYDARIENGDIIPITWIKSK